MSSCGPDGFVLTSEGANQSVNGFGSDLADNSVFTTISDINIDKTPPLLSPSIAPTPVLLNAKATASPGASDDLSGVSSQRCESVVTRPAGDHTVACRATDIAGNLSSVAFHYTVEYKVGVAKPDLRSRWKAGDTVPVRITLSDAKGEGIRDAEARTLLNPCRVTYSLSGAQSASGCMRYEGGDSHTFNAELKLGKATGPATISVTVTYPGTDTITTVSIPITIIR